MTIEKPLIEPINEGYLKGYHSAVDSVARERKWLARTEAPSFAEVETLAKDNIESGNAHYVAVVAGRVVGWCIILPNKREVFSHCGTLGMGIVEAFRGKGIGSSLIRAALSKAKTTGLERVELEVFHNNVSAIALYKNVGFQIEGRKVRAAKLNGEYLDLIQMALFINEYEDIG